MTPTRTDASGPRPASPPAQLSALGQSVWLDYLRRDFLLQGGLRALIERDGVRGVNSDVTTFEQAIAWTGQYDAAVAEWIRRGETEAVRLYERLAVADVQSAADQLRDVYERTDRRDGYVSFSVGADRIDDADDIVRDAVHLWSAVERPNLMIKVPATHAGLAALSELTARGYNVNVAMVCGIDAHARVVDAYLAGLERRDGELGGIASVAGLELDRIAAAAGRWLRTPPAQPVAASVADGTAVAIAVGRSAYRQWKQLHSGRRWTALAARGARPQRLLYAAGCGAGAGRGETTYADALIGRETIASMPIATLEAFRARGVAAPTLEREPDQARAVLEAMAGAGFDFARIAAALVEEGVSAQRTDFQTLISALRRKRAEVQTGLPPLNPPRADPN